MEKESVRYVDEKTVFKTTGNHEEIEFLLVVESIPRNQEPAGIREIRFSCTKASYLRNRVLAAGMEASIRYLAAQRRSTMPEISSENLAYNASLLYCYIARMNATRQAFRKEGADLPEEESKAAFAEGIAYAIPETEKPAGKKELVRLLVAAWGRLARYMAEGRELEMKDCEKKFDSWTFWLGRKIGSMLSALFERGFIPELREENFGVMMEEGTPIIAYLGPGTVVEGRNREKPAPDRP